MIWQAISGAAKALGDTVVGVIKEFHIAPEEALKLEQAVRQSQMDFERQMWALETQDRESARKRESTTNDPTTRRLAYLYTFGYFGSLGALLFGWVDIQADMKGLIDVLMGVLTAGQYSIMAYYFGSSHGSSQKDITLDRVVNHRG